eukprot:5863431-Pyramimonas_sp.AAC.1
MHEARAEFRKILRSRLATTAHEYLHWCISALRGSRASTSYLVVRAVRAYPCLTSFSDVDAGAFFDPQGLHAHIAALINQLLDDEEEALQHAGELPEHEVARRRA